MNQQQNQSGNCALFSALEGYAKNPDLAAHYLEVMQFLINNGANILVHDRKDNTFIHKAISVLSEEDFNGIMETIKNQEHIDFASLFSYINNNDFDIFICCPKEKSLGKAKILLDMFPDYFSEASKNRMHALSFVSKFKNAIQEYNEDDKKALLNLLNNEKYRMSAKFLKGLAAALPEEDRPYNDNPIRP